MSPLNNRVRDLRSRQSLSVAQLANRIGVSRLTLHALESGLYTPSLPLAVRLARALNHPVEDVFVV
ncbi:helix-turn-helix transcriptional regulator [Brevundimonas nasdae]|uniref:helix-turn-helix transcriptional regulator n=1 Tax=Brevundimonas nasdae TaxID=172043 RepID=UPI0027E59183|nr:helix-turn-helix transcriptional regulator [Brevundimonas nasdae]